MEHDRFDALARMLVQQTTRRAAVLLAAALIGAEALAGDEAAAKRKKKKKAPKKAPVVCTRKPPSAMCAAGDECCSGRCEETDAACTPARVICCNPLGQPCQEQCDCCQVRHPSYPDNHAHCLFTSASPGNNVCCINVEGCTRDADCCLHNPPTLPIICDGLGKCCRPTGTPCEFDIDCCTFKVCQGAAGAKTCS